MKKVICPYCGYAMPIEQADTAEAHGLYVRCKGKNCRRVFEIRIEKWVK